MNQPYIPSSVSVHLHTLVRAYPKSWKNIPRSFGKILDFSDESYGTSLISSNIIRKTGLDMPVILSIESEITYAAVVLPDSNYLIGPVRFDEPVFFHRNMTLKSLNIEEQFDKNWLQNVPVCSFHDFYEQILLMFNYRRKGNASEPFLNREQLFAANCVQYEIARKSQEQAIEHILENMDNQIVHNPYSQEQREVNSIREGNMDSLLEAIQEDFTGQYGRLSKNPLRQEKDMGIVTVTLASRAAIEGGLHYETAFNISDRTIQQIESAADIPSVRHFYREAEYELTRLVNNLKAKKKAPPIENRHVSRCKDYIMTHLHEKLTVTQVAEEVGFDRSYISKLFSECEHITMKEFITYEKIQLVKNLLTYSTYSYSRIAAYLGFASQSHLGTEFKKVTGTTLKKFRDANAKGDIFG